MDLPLEDGMIDPVEFRMRKLPVPVYPATEDEILATWNEREEVWKMLKKGTDGSVCSGWCRRRVLITEEKVSVWGSNNAGWYLMSDEV
ncbi:hypothetical protein FRB91_001325 [Serendipita sp. 411]|nr:hypothetical protein FRC16_002796 [Serendipita sp. 398]KAG8845930.1 hypothetical protein FRB91_001325 [Serendipita sp. 411]KAG8867021.1 hypothetical protein FRC20_006918 [Serendipita sp. 405]